VFLSTRHTIEASHRCLCAAPAPPRAGRRGRGSGGVVLSGNTVTLLRALLMALMIVLEAGARPIDPSQKARIECALVGTSS
jgi:hypothetical protein